MDTVNINVYDFEELPEAVQQNVISEWRNDDEYFWNSENEESLNAFCKIFDISIRNYEYGCHNYINASFNLDSEIMELSGLKLHKYLVNNYWRNIYKPKYYYRNGIKRLSKIQLQNDCILTGYYMDSELMAPLYDFIKKPNNIDFETLLNDCLNNWLSACRNDYDYWNSEESIREDILSNDYQFLINGEIYSTKYQQMAA